MIDAGADINYRADNSNSVFLSACLSGSVEMVSLIISRGLYVNDEILLQALNSPSIASHTQIVDILLCRIQDTNYSRGHRDSFLLCASIAGNSSATQYLLDHGATQLSSSLSSAATCGHIEVVKLKLGQGKVKGEKAITTQALRDALVSATRQNT